MKTKLTLLLCFIVPALSIAQETGAADRNFGLGIRASIFQLSDLTHTIMPPNRLLVNFDPSKHFRGEFQFGYNSGSDQSMVGASSQVELSSSCSVFGVGAHYLVVRDQTKFSLGVRYAGYVAADDTYDYTSASVQTNHENWFTIGPVIGGEHFFSKWFSLGAEFSCLIGNGEKEYYNNSFKPETKSTITESSLVFRFYPF